MIEYRKSSIQAGYRKASDLRWWEHARQVDEALWEVDGQGGALYLIVRQPDGDWHCPCLAGQARAFCYHLASCNIRRAMGEAVMARAERQAPAARQDATAAPRPSGGGMRGPRLDDEAAFAEIYG